MAKIILPATLAKQADSEREIEIDGSTVGEILQRLEEFHPALRGWVIDEQIRLRRHVNVFVNDRRVDLDAAVASGDQVWVLQAISGGLPNDTELLVGTHKGLFVLRGPRGGAMEIAARRFPGQTVDFAACDPRSGTYFASVTHGQFGPRIYFASDPEGEWTQANGPAFPADTDAAVTRIWAIVPGEAESELWAGVAPAALFHSTDDGRTWTLVRSLWDVPGRDTWEGGLGGLALHSICPWPGDPQRLAVGISAAGVWITDDGGASWRRGGRGLVPRYLPEEARKDATMLCVHNMRRARRAPKTLFMQFHGGVYRSDDGGETWINISAELPADFGFPLAVDPEDPGSAFVIPLNSDEDRVTVDGRVRVYRTRDRGASWQALSTGLPQEDAFLTVLRQAFCEDAHQPLGLYFGARSGELFGSIDAGEGWALLARHLPPILSVRMGL